MKEEDFPLKAMWDESLEKRLVGLVAKDGQGRFLMQLRDDYAHIPSPAHWALFGGHVETGEALEMAILRELNEELGLALLPSSLTPLARYIYMPAKAKVFIFEINAPIEASSIRLGEGAGFAFLTPSQIHSFPLAASVKDFMRELAPQS